VTGHLHRAPPRLDARDLCLIYLCHPIDAVAAGRGRTAALARLAAAAQDLNTPRHLALGFRLAGPRAGGAQTAAPATSTRVSCGETHRGGSGGLTRAEITPSRVGRPISRRLSRLSTLSLSRGKATVYSTSPAATTPAARRTITASSSRPDSWRRRLRVMSRSATGLPPVDEGGKRLALLRLSQLASARLRRCHEL
jgi:hypothetical protein